MGSVARLANETAARARRGVIYFLQAGDGGAIKIGFCRDLGSRLVTIQTHCPERLVVLGVMGGTRETESRMHDRFSEHRRRGEWFDPAEEIIEFTRLLPKSLPVEPSEKRRVLAMPDDPIEIIALEIGIKPATIRVWRHRGAVPHSRRFDLSQAAAERGFIVRREAFDNFGRPATEAAA